MASLRKSINAKCKDCIYDELAAGSWVMQVEACTCFTCPLWRVRPVRSQRGPWPENVVREMRITPEMAALRAERPHEVPKGMG